MQPRPVILRRPPVLRHPVRFLRYTWDGLRADVFARGVTKKHHYLPTGWTVARVTPEGSTKQELWLCRPGKPNYPYFSADDTPSGRRWFLHMAERSKERQDV